MRKNFIASCDRIECGIAVLIEDENEKEHKVYPPLSSMLIEGGVYECCIIGDRVVSVTHLTKTEKERRERAREVLMRLTSKNK